MMGPSPSQMMAHQMPISPGQQQSMMHQQQMFAANNMANNPQLYFHLQREQAMNMFRSGAQFFDAPRFNLPSKFDLIQKQKKKLIPFLIQINRVFLFN